MIAPSGRGILAAVRRVDEAALDDLHRLEERLGIPVVAYEAASPYADLTDAQLAEIQRAEAALGVRLLAYRRG